MERWCFLVIVLVYVVALTDVAEAQGYKGVPLPPTAARSGVSYIITHDTYGPPGSAINAMNAFLQGRGRPGCERCGTEWWVMASGEIYHATPERVTSHCSRLTPQCSHRRGGTIVRGCNAQSVGIEFEGYPYRQKTQAQVQSGLALIRFLQNRYCITSDKVYAHMNDDAPLCSEGLTMQNAARELNHTPDCSNSGANSLSYEGIGSAIVTRAMGDYVNYTALDRLPPGSPILAGLFSTPTYSPHIPQRPLGGLQGLFNSFGTGASSGFPTALVPAQSSSSAHTALQHLAYDPHSHDVVDADSQAADEAAAKHPGKAVSVVIPSDGVTAVAEVRDDDGKVLDVVTVSYEHIGAPSTFAPLTSPESVVSGDIGAPSATAGVYNQLVSIVTRVRDILTALVGYLTGNR